MNLADDDLRELAQRLTGVGGIVGVTLGGSRARGVHSPGSDVDLGLYYRPPLDVEALGALAREVAGPQAVVTRPGEWGPWVDGGGWLQIAGTAVDWIGRLPGPVRFADRAHAVLGRLGTGPLDLLAAVTDAGALVAETTSFCRKS